MRSRLTPWSEWVSWTVSLVRLATQCQAYHVRIPVGGETVMVQLGQGDGGGGSGGVSLIDAPGGRGRAGIRDIDVLVEVRIVGARLDGVGRGQLGRLVGGRIDHQQEALFGGRQLGDVVIGMRAADVFLHGAKAFFLGC